MFDGCLKELEEFSRKNELDGYMTDKEELYHFMENVLLLQLGERNELVYEARQTGALVQTALKTTDASFSSLTVHQSLWKLCTVKILM